MGMNKSWIRTSASLAILVFAAGCSNPKISDAGPGELAPPPPPAAIYEPPAPPPGHVETTELLGGPGGPPPPPGYEPDVVTMAPIPNPEDLSPEDRAELYGAPHARHRQPRQNYYASGDHVRAGHPRRHRHERAARHSRQHHAAAPRADRHPSIATAPGPISRPIPTTKPTPASVRPGSSTQAPASKVVIPAPAPLTPVPGLPKAAENKNLPVTELLGGAVAPDVVAGSKFNVPGDLAKGEQSVVSLTLPPTLFDRIKAEAAKLGLVREASTVDGRATLSGDGYTIIPSAAQSARLKAGESATFNWQVTPLKGDLAKPLRAEVSGELKGGAKPQTFKIATLEQTPGAAAKDAAATGNADADGKTTSTISDRLALPGVKSGLLFLAGLGFLILVVLTAMVNSAAARRRASERQRKFRAAPSGRGDAVESEAHHKDDNPA